MSKRTEQIVELERQAERHTGKAAACHWQAAELVVAELATGKTGTKLAGQIGKTAGWVSKAAKAWRQHGGVNLEQRPSWGDAINDSTRVERTAANRTAMPRDPAERMALVRKIVPTLGPNQAADVQHLAQAVRAGRDMTPAGRKAGEARGAEATEPLRQAVKGMRSAVEGTGVEQLLLEAADKVRELVADDALRPAELRKIERAHGELVAALAEAVQHLEGVPS